MIYIYIFSNIYIYIYMGESRLGGRREIPVAERNVAITPANVAVQMGRERVAGPALVNVIRNSKRKFGEQANFFFLQC